MVMLFVFAMGATVKTIYHSWFVITGIRYKKRRAANLLGPFFLLMPSLFEVSTLAHRKQLGFWLPITIAAYAVLFGIEALLAQP